MKNLKNFGRVLRHTWPYRVRLAVSVLCAVTAAGLWGASFTSIYPVLKLLTTQDTLHTWVDRSIADLSKDAARLDTRIDALTAKEKKLDALEQSARVLKEKRDLASELLRQENHLRAVRFKLYWTQVLAKYIHEYLPEDAFKTLAYVFCAVLVAMGLKCFFEFWQESLVGSVVNFSLYGLRNRAFNNVIHLDVGQFADKGTSDLTARFTNDVEALGNGLKLLFGRVVAEPLRVVACVIVACCISWQLTFFFLILVPVAGLILYRVGRMMRHATRRVLERMSSIYKILQETFSGIRTVKAYTMEAYERRRFRAATREYHRRAQNAINVEALSDPVIEMLGVTAIALALLAGSYLVLNQHTHLFGLRMSDTPLEPEALLQLYLCLAAIADPVRKLSSVFTKLQAAGVAADRIFEIIDRKPHVEPNYDGTRLPRPAWLPARRATMDVPPPVVLPIRPSYVEFRDVCFSYKPGVPVLSQINLTVRAGETIGIVGPNGCGKSTLINLLSRFCDPDHGSVFIDGHDLRDVQVRSLRQLVGIVTQSSFMFDDTIASNIAYGTRGATQAEIEAAAKLAQAHDFIIGLPKGYDTRAGEMNFEQVSGGQKQRLALARAILRNPSILILDEFTSANDTISDAEIHKTLVNFKQGRTVFMITHRLHTLEIADRIVVLDAGRIVAVGTHVELLASCPTYQRLQEAQTQKLVA